MVGIKWVLESSEIYYEDLEKQGILLGKWN